MIFTNRLLIDRAEVVVKSPGQKEFRGYAAIETNQSLTLYSSPTAIPHKFARTLHRTCHTRISSKALLVKFSKQSGIARKLYQQHFGENINGKLTPISTVIFKDSTAVIAFAPYSIPRSTTIVAES
jgi:hypothetical protein